MISAREKFCALALTAPLMRADATVVLAGEDGRQRAAVAEGLLRQGASGMIVLTGSLSAQPSKYSADDLEEILIGRGISPERIIVDPLPAVNTRQQAENVVALAKEKGWRQLLLVASSYHIPRAMLTFIHALDGAEIRIVPVTANQVRWTEPPEGLKQTRFRLLENEFAKVEQYVGHVASYSEGIAYMCGWEGK